MEAESSSLSGMSNERDIQMLEKLMASTLESVEKVKTGATISKCKDIFLQGVAQIDSSQKSLKAEVEQLSEVCKREQDNLSELHNETLGGSSHQNMKADITQKQREKVNVNEEILSLTESITHKEQLLKQMDAREKDVNDTWDILPKIKQQFETFGGITNLKWDYNAPDNLVKGVIFKPEKKELCPFELDRNNHSQFFITNHLWSLMEQDDDFF